MGNILMEMIEFIGHRGFCAFVIYRTAQGNEVACDCGFKELKEKINEIQDNN